MTFIERFDKLFKIISLASYLYLVYTYFQLWISPSITDANSVSTYSTLILLEFVLIHSGAFMLVLSKSRFAFLFFFVLYLLVVLAFNAITPGNTIIYTYLIVVFNRMKWVLYKPSEDAKETLMAYSMVTGFIYLLCIIVIFWVLGENGLVPHFGLTEEYLLTSGYKGMGNPHVNLAFGAVYFTLLSIGKIVTTFSRKKKKKHN
jgi:hypothetical protein